MECVLEKLRSTKDWSDIIDILSEIDENDVTKIKSLIPGLLGHSSWVVRAECLDLIGDFRLVEFLPLVRKRLKDRNKYVRAYALAASYDIKKEKSLPLLRRYVQNRDIDLRTMALSLLYVETESPDVLKKIEKIVTRKNCDYHHKFNVLNQFEHYLDIKQYPEINDLYRKILKTTSPKDGVAREIKDIIKGLEA